MKRLVVFGDSIAFGQGVSLHLGWVAKLSKSVDETFEGQVLIVNSSINGNTTHDALNRIAYEIQNPGADVVIIQFGLNDCNYWITDKGLPRVSIPSFRANLQEIIARCFHFGASKVFLVTNHPTDRRVTFDHAPVTYEESSKVYNTEIRKVANFDDRIELIDIEKIFLEKFNYGGTRMHLLDDGLHLSVHGHEVYADSIIQLVIDHLKKL